MWSCLGPWTRRRIANRCQERISLSGFGPKMWQSWSCGSLMSAPGTSREARFRWTAPMYEAIAILFVYALYAYTALGLAFALAFVTVGVKRVDSQAIGSSVGFRVLIFPGSVAFWPLLFC